MSYHRVELVYTRFYWVLLGFTRYRNLKRQEGASILGCSRIIEFHGHIKLLRSNLFGLYQILMDSTWLEKV